MKGLAPPLTTHLPRRLCSDLWLGLVPMPLVLESEGPRLDGVEGEIRELGGEEKPSWGQSTRGQPQAPGCVGQRERMLGSELWAPPLRLWETELGIKPHSGMWGRGITADADRGWGNMGVK